MQKVLGLKCVKLPIFPEKKWTFSKLSACNNSEAFGYINSKIAVQTRADKGGIEEHGIEQPGIIKRT